MFRPTAVTLTTLCCLLAAACDALVGSVDVDKAPLSPPPPPEGPRPAQPEAGSPSPGAPVRPPVQQPTERPGADAGVAASLDAGPDGDEVDAGVEPAPEPEPEPEPTPLPRPVVVDGPAQELERVGLDGGEPRRGVCVGGFVIGVRPSANPNEDNFGQRLTFIEPICGTAIHDPASGTVRVTRDDATLVWDESGDFQGIPTNQVPDDRLLWVVQPSTLCPDATPVLVGLTGEFDPVAPGSDTSAVRSLEIECAPIAVADNGVDVGPIDSGHQIVTQADSFATSGEEAYRSSCAAGSVATQLQLHAGFWLDGFVLGCASLRSPNLAGEPCAAERDCQSGVCAPEGSCSP